MDGYSSTSNSLNSSITVSTNGDTDVLDYILEEEEIEEEDDEMLETTIAALLTTINQRSEAYTCNRMRWEEHIQKLFKEGPTGTAYYSGHYQAFGINI